MTDLSKWIAAVHCPSRSEMIDIAVAALPHGRAWQTDEIGPDRGVVGGFQRSAFQNDAFAVEHRTPSILFQYWSAVGEFLAFAAQRFCALRLEFWCATKSETTDLWMEEYGLPDACDPFPDLCTKVSAIGGTRCEYYAAVAARAGWSIDCDQDVCVNRAGMSYAGCSMAGTARRTPILNVYVNRAESVSYVATGLERSLPFAGQFRSGRPLSCPYDGIDKSLVALDCLLARIVHAEIEIVYKLKD